MLAEHSVHPTLAVMGRLEMAKNGIKWNKQAHEQPTSQPAGPKEEELKFATKATSLVYMYTYRAAGQVFFWPVLTY